MSMFKGQLLIFLIIYINKSSGVMDAPLDAVRRIWEFYTMLGELNLSCSALNPRTVSVLTSDDRKEMKKIKDQVDEIHAILREIENSINSKMMDTLLNFVRSAIFIYECVDKMGIFISKIADDYGRFYQIIISNLDTHDRSLENLTTLIFPDIESNLGMIRNIMTNPHKLLPGESSLITAIIRYAETQDPNSCNIHQSIDDILIYLFKITMIAEIKTNLMLPFANLHQCRTNEEWENVNRDAMAKFQRYFRSYSGLIQQNLNLANHLYIRACDPRNGAWILDFNYYELLETTQLVIFRYLPRICERESCQYMWEQRTARCDAKYYDERSGCSSTPTNCENFGVVNACVLKNGPKKFQYIHSPRLGFFGNNSECPQDEAYMIDNRKGPHSGYATCGCQCHEDYNKISLLTMTSRVDDNEVIIGVRFKRSVGILHIQPRVGILSANGYIQKNSERWLGIPNEIDASQIHSADENTIFFFDNILLQPNFVLTGVKFEIARRENVAGLAITIIGSPFDYRRGVLDKDETSQLSWRTSPGRPLTFASRSSILPKNPTEPSSTDMGYVQLKKPLSRDDFGQSLLPLFDAVPVTTDPPSALSGFGIFHKGREGYPGFISLRIHGINYKQYFEKFTIAD